MPQYEREQSGIARFLQIIWRRLWFIIAAVVIVTSASVYIGSQQEATFTASAQIVLEPKDNRGNANELVATGLSNDASAIETQIKLLRARAHVRKVIANLGLQEQWAKDPSPGEDQEGDESTILGSMGDLLRSWTSTAESVTLEEPVETLEGRAMTDLLDQVPEDSVSGAIFDRFDSGYRVQQEGRSYVISIYFTSEDPIEASQIVDQSARVFIESKREDKLGFTNRTSQWLSGRADTLRRELAKIEDNITVFRETNGVLANSGSNDSRSVEVVGLVSELAKVRGDISSKEATLSLIKQLQLSNGNLQDIAEVSASPILQNLLTEQRIRASREAELGKTYGERHPAMVELKSEQERIQLKIDQEILRFVSIIANDLKILESRRETLSREIANLRQLVSKDAKARLKLNDLLRRAETTRDLYQSILQRSKEISEQQEMVEPDVRAVSQATIPTNPSSPGVKMFGAIGFCASSIVSVMLILLWERNDRSLRTTGQVTEYFGIESVYHVPQIKEEEPPHLHVIKQPLSLYADAVRSVCFMLKRQTNDGQGTIVLTTSSLPDEGKSTFSLSLATVAAAQGMRTLIIDLDLRHPQLQTMSGVDAGAGIAEFCRDEDISIDDCIVYDDETDLHYWLVKERPRDPSMTIGSKRFAAALELLKDEFEFIVMDAAPVLAVTETRLLLQHADHVAFCIRWGYTDVETVDEALLSIESSDTDAPLVGVLTRVDMKKGASYGLSSSKHHKAFKKYYQYQSDI